MIIKNLKKCFIFNLIIVLTFFNCTSYCTKTGSEKSKNSFFEESIANYSYNTEMTQSSCFTDITSFSDDTEMIKFSCDTINSEKSESLLNDFYFIQKNKKHFPINEVISPQPIIFLDQINKNTKQNQNNSIEEERKLKRREIILKHLEERQQKKQKCVKLSDIKKEEHTEESEIYYSNSKLTNKQINLIHMLKITQEDVNFILKQKDLLEELFITIDMNTSFPISICVPKVWDQIKKFRTLIKEINNVNDLLKLDISQLNKIIRLTKQRQVY